MEHIIPPHLAWLQREAPGFSLFGEQITVLYSPDKFYAALLEGCRRAEDRITLAALYIGTGDLENNLVKELDASLTRRKEKLSVNILLDAVRDSRDASARTQLLPLVQKHPKCQVSLFHNPDLRGPWLRLLPARANEAVGVQHIKIYVFDNDVIISGANLTKDYFTDRQDRYMLISKCKVLADFCEGLINRVSSVSFRLTEDGQLLPRCPVHPYLEPKPKYEKYAREVIWQYYLDTLKAADKQLKPGHDTWIFPLIQVPQAGILQDSTVTQDILESLPAETTVQLTSPYFNLPDMFVTSFLHKCKAEFDFLIPHPTASDFHGARGFAGQIPFLYTALADNFLLKIEDSKQERRLKVQEFVRSNGSYHSKGLWLTDNSEEPYMTIIGSSNFNERSVKRDLECQLVILSGNQTLRKKLFEEKHRLYKHGVPFSRKITLQPERKPKLWHHLLLWLFKGYF